LAHEGIVVLLLSIANDFSMRHHLQRAKHVYETRGPKELITAAVKYVPVEINNLIFRARYGPGTRVMDEDWDTLILLDASRYDMFADQIDFKGKLESRISLGSTSEEFLECNFGEGTFHDTVYVNTNPYLPQLGLDNETFHAVVDLLDEWDPELQTVHPQTVVEAAKKAHTEYPNKRHIVHFMQPHYPFIGKIGVKIEARGWKNRNTTVDGDSIWGQLRNGTTNISIDTVWRAYTENLDIALDQVESLLNSTSGKTVISADHGNLVGERYYPLPSKRKYGHPYGVYLPELVKVPWFVVESGGRRQIQSDSPVAAESSSDEIIEDRLQALGYK